MNIKVTNKKITVGDIEVNGVSSSSIFLIGDTELITNSSIFDTPSDSLIIDPRIPELQKINLNMEKMKKVRDCL